MTKPSGSQPGLAKMRHSAKFYGDRWNRCWDMAFFIYFLKMAAAAVLDFQHEEIWGTGRVKRVKLYHLAIFRGDRSNRCWDMAIFRFRPFDAIKWLPKWTSQTNGWDPLASLGHPCKFQRVSRLGSVTARGTLVVGVSQTLRRWTEGATYIRQGGHHVGHWPTF